MYTQFLISYATTLFYVNVFRKLSLDIKYNECACSQFQKCHTIIIYRNLVYNQVSILTPLNNNTRVSRVNFIIQWKCL